jgi:hypothetical protein
MTRPRTVRRLLVVEAQELDSDRRSRHEIELDAPTDESGQRAQLATMVGQMHPGARMRSFGGEAASFLGKEHLVVAHYAGAVDEESPPGSAGSVHVEQQLLFAV